MTTMLDFDPRPAWLVISNSRGKISYTLDTPPPKKKPKPPVEKKPTGRPSKQVVITEIKSGNREIYPSCLAVAEAFDYSHDWIYAVAGRGGVLKGYRIEYLL